jgi:hypothetical protein
MISTGNRKGRLTAKEEYRLRLGHKPERMEAKRWIAYILLYGLGRTAEF